MGNLPKSVVVTGAGSGIGLALAKYLLGHGVRVLAADINADGLRELQDAKCTGLTSSVCDLCDSAQLRHFFSKAKAIGFDGAVNCAGTAGQPDYFVLQNCEAIEAVLDVNIRGTLNCIREELHHLLPQRQGSIVNLASIYGLRGQPRWAVYSATKAAVIGLTQGVALEIAQSGIRINAVAPGPIETPLLQRATEGNLQRTAAMVPMKRNGSSGEVVQAIAWLLSDASSYVTGTVLSVDGGMVAQAATVPDIALPTNSSEVR